eukprot:4498117-Amphidinium_carterae.1
MEQYTSLAQSMTYKACYCSRVTLQQERLRTSEILLQGLGQLELQHVINSIQHFKLQTKLEVHVLFVYAADILICGGMLPVHG